MTETEYLDELCAVIASRVKENPKGSYVSGLVAKGLDAVRDKIDEESSELVEASMEKGRKDIVWEAADLLFHMLVLLEAHGIPFSDVVAELKSRQRPER